MKNLIFWRGKPLNSEKKTNGRDLIGSGMHLLRQFERELLEVDRKGRKKKAKAVVVVDGSSKGNPIFVKNHSKKVLETLASLPLADLRRRAHVKRKQRKLISQQKHWQLGPYKPETKKAVRFVWKSPVKAVHWTLKKYQEKFAHNRHLDVDPSYLIKTRRRGSFSYDMVPWISRWDDTAFWLSELFPKLYFRHVARFSYSGKLSRKFRRRRFRRRINKSRRKDKKKKKSSAYTYLKVQEKRMSMPSERCARCLSPFCSGVENLYNCCELGEWKQRVRGEFPMRDDEQAVEAVEGQSSGSPLREVVYSELEAVDAVEVVISRRDSRLTRLPKRKEYLAPPPVGSRRDWYRRDFPSLSDDEPG